MLFGIGMLDDLIDVQVLARLKVLELARADHFMHVIAELINLLQRLFR